MNALVFNEYPIVINRVLAKIIGLNESIVLQQLNYWIENNKKKNINFHDGHYWTYNSMKKWHEDAFDFWSLDTLKRAFKSLENKELIITGNYNREARDRTKWYTINFEKLEGISQCISAKCTNGKVQNAPMHEGNLPQPLPETSTEINTEISKDINITIKQEQQSLLDKKNVPQDKIPYDEIFNAFNSICVSLPKVIKRTSRRCTNVKARWKEYKSMEPFITVFKMAEESDFLSGRNNKWAGCNFDWLMRKNKFIQVLEGNYRNVQGLNNFKNRNDAVQCYSKLESEMQQRLLREQDDIEFDEKLDSKSIMEQIRYKAENKAEDG